MIKITIGLEFPSSTDIDSEETSIAWIDCCINFLDEIHHYSLNSYIGLSGKELVEFTDRIRQVAWDIEDKKHCDIALDITFTVKLIIVKFLEYLERLPNPISRVNYKTVYKFTFNGLDELRQMVKNLL